MTNEEFQALVLKHLSRIENRIDGLDNRIDGLDNRMGGLETKVDKLQEDITGIKHELGYVWEDIKKIDNRLSTNEEELVFLRRLK